MLWFCAKPPLFYFRQSSSHRGRRWFHSVSNRNQSEIIITIIIITVIIMVIIMVIIFAHPQVPPLSILPLLLMLFINHPESLTAIMGHRDGGKAPRDAVATRNRIQEFLACILTSGNAMEITLSCGINRGRP